MNIELPTRDALQALAPEKSESSIKKSMGAICLKLDEAKQEGRKAPKFSPAGQSTQIIVGAESSTDCQHLGYGGQLVSLVSPEANLLLGLQPYPAFFRSAAQSRAAAGP